MERSSAAAAAWMTGLHRSIEALLPRHAVRKIETRGDCYIVLTGGGVAENDDPGTQMRRMLRFAREVARELREDHGAQVRFGAATGPVTVSYIATHRFAPTMVACGDVVNTAARMEQTGRPGLLHLTAEAAQQLHREHQPPHRPPLPSPPLHATAVKSKGTLLTAWYDLTHAGDGPEGFLTTDPLAPQQQSPAAEDDFAGAAAAVAGSSLAPRSASLAGPPAGPGGGGCSVDMPLAACPHICSTLVASGEDPSWPCCL